MDAASGWQTMDDVQCEPEGTEQKVMIVLERYSAHVSAAYPLGGGPPDFVLRAVLLHFQDRITCRQSSLSFDPESTP